MAAHDSPSQNSTLTSYDGVRAFTASNASQGAPSVSSYGSPTVLTIGNFDGVHIGHQELIRQAVAKARGFGVPSVVFTFEPHPLMVLRPELGLKRLFDPEDRREQLEKLGVDILVVEPFSRSFSQLTPEKFLIENVIRPFQPRAVVVGYDFSFGANRAGGIDFLNSHAESTGSSQTKIFDVDVVPPVKIEIEGQNTIVSSTRIRQAINEGRPEIARALLGRPYMLRGLVRKGAGRGRTIGIPTANIEPTVEVGVKPGVYAAQAKVRGRSLNAMVNIGTNPTFEGSHSVTMHIEAHLPHYDGEKEGDLYGETIELGFIERIRDEKKFSGFQELVAQIHRDIDLGVGHLGARRDRPVSARLHLRTVGATAFDEARTKRLGEVFGALSSESVATLEDLGPIPDDAPTVVRLFGRANTQVMTWLGAKGRVVSDAAVLGFADGILYERFPTSLPPRAIAVTPAAFVSAFASAKPHCDTSAAAIILGACEEARVVAAGLSRLGFKRILVSDPEDAKTDYIVQVLRKRLFGIAIQAVSRSALTQLPNECSIAINLVGQSEDLFLEDVSYLNFLRNSASGRDKSGIWIDWTGATIAMGHADEISNAGAQIVSGDLIRAWRDVMLLEGVPGLIDETGRRPEVLVEELLKTDPS